MSLGGPTWKGLNAQLHWLPVRAINRQEPRLALIIQALVLEACLEIERSRATVRNNRDLG